MENSILISTKKVLGIGESYTAFDPDIIMFINTSFSSLAQLGVGEDDGFFIQDETSEWSELGLPDKQLHMVKSFVFLKCRVLFDPPGTSFLLEAMDNQIKEFEWRLNVFREVELP
jgi:hypothetical protein